MKGFYKRAVICGIFLLAGGSFFAQQVSPGVKLFCENNPAGAIPLLEQELKNSNPSGDLYNYLGLAYSQTGNYQKAVEVFEKGLNVFGTNKKVLYYNKANAYYALSDFEKACDCYSMAIIADSSFAAPYLNRANSYLQLNDIEKCEIDYLTYLELAPNDPQEPQIRELLSLLRKEKEIRIAEQKRREEEAERLRQEEERLAAAKAEQERLAAIKRAEEEERRRKLLEEVANSLKKGSETTNMSAGAEDVLSYEEESDID